MKVTCQEKQGELGLCVLSEKSGEDEILTPFQAVQGIRIEAPSYWLGCCYTYERDTNNIYVTIRQTGVLPDVATLQNFQRLDVNIYLVSLRKKRRHTVTLIKSRKDKSFRSRILSFKHVSIAELSCSRLVVQVVLHKRFSKVPVDVMNFSLSSCHSGLTKTELKRVNFPQN